MNGAGTPSPEGTKSGARAPFLAFTSDSASAETLKAFATSHGWSESVVHEGDIVAATQFLKTHPSPIVLCVDIASAEKAAAELDALAEVCDPNIKVIVSGKINEYSFYCWLVEVGISNYLLKPFSSAALEAAYHKATEIASVAVPAPEEKKDAKIITVLGARGGVGATTVSVNLAWILANQLRQKTALLDFDPQLGTIALALDLEPGRGLRDALEKPDRIDGLFMDRVMLRIDDYLSILSTEESLEENIVAGEGAARALFTQMRPKFSHVVVDLPRTLTPFTRYAIAHADHVLCVTEYTLTGLRESLRYLDYCRNILKIPAPIFVANRVGLAGKHQMPQAEFEKGLGEKIAFNVPFVLDAYATNTMGDVLADKVKNAPVTKALQSLASHFVEGALIQEPKAKLQELLARFIGGK